MKFNQILLEKVIKKMYHGTSVKNHTFDTRYADMGTAQEGAGFYFAEDEHVAMGYAGSTGWVYEVELTLSKQVSYTKKASRKDIEYLIKKAPNLKDTLSNWGEFYPDNLNTAIDSMIQYSSHQKDTFEQIWYDFYNGKADKFLKEMVKLGYDGFEVKATRGHVVMWNVDKINIIKKTKVKDIK